MRIVRKPKPLPVPEAKNETRVEQVVVTVKDHDVTRRVEELGHAVEIAEARAAVMAPRSLRCTFGRDKQGRVSEFVVKDGFGMTIANGDVERDSLGYLTAIVVERAEH